MPRRPSLHGSHHAVRLLVLALLVVVLAGAGGAAGRWWGERQSGTYVATVVILLNPLQGNPFSPDSRGEDLVNLETEAQLVTSDTVVKRVALDHPDLPPLDVASVVVTVPPNTQLLDIEVTAADSEVAQQTAAALGQVYLTHRRNRTASALFNERANINEQLDERAAERTELTRSLDKSKPGSAASVQVTQQVLAVVTQISELRAQLGVVGAASVDPGQVVTPAEVAPHGPLTAGPELPGLLGALLGLLVAAAVTSRLVRPDGVVRVAADLEGLSGLGAPAWVATMAGADGGVSGGSRLRALALASGGGRRVVVLACHVGRGPTGPAVRALADSCVASRLRTVTVEVGAAARADDEGLAGAASGPGNPPGLLEVLRDDVPLSSAVTWRGDRGLLGAGCEPGPLDDLAASAGMEHVVVALREASDVVVLDAGAASSARALALLPHVDVVLLEVAVGSVTLEEIEDEIDELRAAGEAAVGVVLVPRARKHRRARRRRDIREVPPTAVADEPPVRDQLSRRRAEAVARSIPRMERLTSFGSRVEAGHE
ncbi:hypothetical protein [Nocardioides sp.]|uniref:hypothetical protein n=1 Tax=Nocardioides sp. TaxID=35761 RepID=UPI002B268C6E|nr:hypothetical protein [Nocardioides sp.]